MKLYYGKLSPFVRKVMVVAHEKAVVAQLELIATALTPTEPNLQLMQINPLGKIPTLVLDDGTALLDSPVICEYLDTLDAATATSKLFPSTGAARFRALQLHALADGLLVAAMALRIEGTRPAEKQWDQWLEAQSLKVRNTLDALNSPSFAPSGSSITIGEIAVGCALGWLDFRMPQLAWRSGRDNLGNWFESFSRRPSMIATAPQ